MALRYPNRPILGAAGLSRALRTPLLHILETGERSKDLYRLAQSIEKPDGTIRQTFDALPPLKPVQQRIQAQILKRIQFPDFITGSVKGKDAVANARIHAGAKIVVCEDIANFFPATTSSLVNSIWLGFFGFGHEAAELLTLLTTKDGGLPQGAVTSSYLANLAFWKREEGLHAKFEARGIAYSRYVDDVTISSKTRISNSELTWAIGQIYGMMRSSGYDAKRKKHEISRAHGQMSVTKLQVNVKPALPKAKRRSIRSEVYHIEKDAEAGGPIDSRRVSSAKGKVGYLKRMHPRQAATLKLRLDSLK